MFNSCVFRDIYANSVIILAGGMAQAGEILRSAVEKAMHRRSWTILPTDTKIVLSSQSSDSVGVYGAALAAKAMWESQSPAQAQAQAHGAAAAAAAAVESEGKEDEGAIDNDCRMMTMTSCASVNCICMVSLLVGAAVGFALARVLRK